MDKFDYDLPEGLVVEDYKINEYLKIRKGNFFLEMKMKKHKQNWNNEEILGISDLQIKDSEGKIVKNVYAGYHDSEGRGVEHGLRELKKFPSADEEKSELKTIHEVINKFFKYSGEQYGTGNSGIIAQYYRKPCVIAYAGNMLGGVIFFKTVRKYKAMVFGKTDFVRLYETELDIASKMFEEISQDKVQIKELSDKHKAAIIAERV